MLEEAVSLLVRDPSADPSAQRPAIFVDCTFGAGGLARALLDRTHAKVVAIDADLQAFERAQSLRAIFGDRLVPAHSNFAELARVLGALRIGEVDGIVYDLGLSSLQLADPERGFALRTDAPLDMRFNPLSQPSTAADLLASLSEGDLAELLRTNADERNARRIARNIVKRRERSPLRRSGDLVAAVLSALPAGSRRRHSSIHPATRTFQALRMAVNDELESLRRSLKVAPALLKPGGRIVAISFHSGEDRVVKRAFVAMRAAGVARILTPKPLRPSHAEAASNPRSRSAKLRAAEKIADIAIGVPEEAA